jgi:hypothetical protein
MLCYALALALVGMVGRDLGLGAFSTAGWWLLPALPATITR